MNSRLDFDANLNVTRTLDPAPRAHEEEPADLLVNDRLINALVGYAENWRKNLKFLPDNIGLYAEHEIENAILDGQGLATHMKRSLAQRARWMLAEHLKETRT